MDSMAKQHEEDWPHLFKQAVPLNGIIEQHPTQQSLYHGEHYFNQYKKIYLTAFKLSTSLRNLQESKRSFKERLSKIEKKADQFEDCLRKEMRIKRKRSRRIADEIQRKYVCQAEYCGKCYGSEGSLQQHIKIKHPDIYVSKSTDSA